MVQNLSHFIVSYLSGNRQAVWLAYVIAVRPNVHKEHVDEVKRRRRSSFADRNSIIDPVGSCLLFVTDIVLTTEYISEIALDKSWRIPAFV